MRMEHEDKRDMVKRYLHKKHLAKIAQLEEFDRRGELSDRTMLAEAYDSADKKEFYDFTLALDALKASLTGDEKTVILDGSSELAKILTGAE